MTRVARVLLGLLALAPVAGWAADAHDCEHAGERKVESPDGRWVARGTPGLVHYAVFRGVNHRQRYVVVHGWETEAALAGFRDRPTTLPAGVVELGGSFSQFTGIERASAISL